MTISVNIPKSGYKTLNDNTYYSISKFGYLAIGEVVLPPTGGGILLFGRGFSRGLRQ